jgi:hypothetical protein
MAREAVFATNWEGRRLNPDGLREDAVKAFDTDKVKRFVGCDCPTLIEYKANGEDDFLTVREAGSMDDRGIGLYIEAPTFFPDAAQVAEWQDELVKLLPEDEVAKAMNDSLVQWQAEQLDAWKADILVQWEALIEAHDPFILTEKQQAEADAKAQQEALIAKVASLPDDDATKMLVRHLGLIE